MVATNYMRLPSTWNMNSETKELNFYLNFN